MANWKGFSLTDKGFDLQSKVDAGTATLRFTKVSIGSGKAQGSVPSELVHKEKDLTIGSITPEGALVKIVSTLTNVGVKKAFKEQEMGLYAQDPDEGEILFAYMTDDNPDTLPAEGSTTIVTKRITLALTFSNTGNVTAVLDGNQLMTFGDLVSKTMDPSASSNVDGKAPSTSWVKNAISKVTVNGAKQDSNGNIDLTEVINEIRAWATPEIGQILITRSNESPARKYTGTTWELLQGGLFLSTAGGGTAAGTITGSDTHKLTESELPSHTHSASIGQSGAHTHSITIAEAGSHSHTRGTMNITGAFPGVGDTGTRQKVPTGAFYVEKPNAGVTVNDSGDPDDYFGFDASKTWTGNTSVEGDHSHTANIISSGAHSHSISISKTGSGASFNIRPRNIAYYMWIRTK